MLSIRVCFDIVPNGDFYSKPVVKSINFHNNRGKDFLYSYFYLNYIFISNCITTKFFEVKVFIPLVFSLR